MPKLYILVGLPGSGKSTWAKRICNANNHTVIVNQDSFRTMLFGKYKYDLNVELTIKSAASFFVTTLLHQGFSVIIDETNITKKKRATWLEVASEPALNHKSPVSISYIWFTEADENVDYRMQDDPRGYSKEHWASVVAEMKSSFEPPDASEFNPFGILADIQQVAIKTSSDTGWIGVDLDGTLAFYDGWRGEEIIGEPVPLMMNHVRMWLAAGQVVKIMTARASTPSGKIAVEKWLTKNNLFGVEVTNTKDYKMKALYDDRAFRVEENTGIIRK